MAETAAGKINNFELISKRGRDNCLTKFVRGI